MNASRLAALLLLSFGLSVGGAALAAEPATTDEALFRDLLGDPAAIDIPEGESSDAVPPNIDARPEPNDPDRAVARPAPSRAASLDPRAVERIASSLHDAEQGLADGRTGEATRAAQRATIAELDRLIDAAKSAGSTSDSQSGSDGDSPQPQQAGAAAPQPRPAEGDPMHAGDSASAAGEPGRNREGKAEESSDRANGRRDGAGTIRNFRSELVRDAWGHLPPRLRDQLLNAGSDKYLPQYDSLVRRYFESLAQPEETTDPR